jgi:hypothetical protein
MGKSYHSTDVFLSRKPKLRRDDRRKTAQTGSVGWNTSYRIQTVVVQKHSTSGRIPPPEFPSEPSYCTGSRKWADSLDSWFSSVKQAFPPIKRLEDMMSSDLSSHWTRLQLPPTVPAPYLCPGMYTKHSSKLQLQGMNRETGRLDMRSNSSSDSPSDLPRGSLVSHGAIYLPINFPS